MVVMAAFSPRKARRFGHLIQHPPLLDVHEKILAYIPNKGPRDQQNTFRTMKGIKIADCQTPTILANQAKEKQQDFLAVASDLGGGEQNLLHPDPKQREEVEKKTSRQEQEKHHSYHRYKASVASASQRSFGIRVPFKSDPAAETETRSSAND